MKVWSDSKRWLKFAGKFAGNESRTLSNNVERLRKLVADEKAMKYVDAFRCFNQVVSACYGDQLSPDFMEKIQEFAKSYMKLKISVTPKLHAVDYHVGVFCLLTSRGLGSWSEQTGELIHHDFSKTWEKFKIKDIDHPLYGEQLLKAVTMYNSQHL